MKNLLNDTYKGWLRRFIANYDKNDATIYRANQLLEALEGQLAIDDFIDLFEQFSPPVVEHCGPIHIPYSTILNQQIVAWRAKSQQLKENYQQASVALNGLKLTSDYSLRAPKVAALIKLLQQLMEQSNSYLHHHMPSIIGVLISDKFTETINFLANLSEEPLPIAKAGDFYSVQSVDEAHDACKKLLRSVAAKFEEKEQSAELHLANSLLQNVLMVHVDLNSSDHWFNPVSYCALV